MHIQNILLVSQYNNQLKLAATADFGNSNMKTITNISIDYSSDIVACDVENNGKPVCSLGIHTDEDGVADVKRLIKQIGTILNLAGFDKKEVMHHLEINGFYIADIEIYEMYE